MTTKKPTKRDRFNALLSIPTVAANSELVAFIEHELELLDRKNSVEKKPTAKQIENEGIKEVILSVLMNADAPMTISDIIKAHADLADMSTQKISPLTRQLCDEGKVIRNEDKRKALFSIAPTE